MEEGDQSQYLTLRGKFEDEWHKTVTSPTPKTTLRQMVKRTSSNLFKNQDVKNNRDHSTLINNPVYNSTSKPSGLLGAMGDIDISRQISIDGQQQPLITPGILNSTLRM